MEKGKGKESIVRIGDVLNDGEKPLKQRFRALFTLKNLGGLEAVQQISRCFDDPSALLKHELAYCLGQMRDTNAIPKLIQVLKDSKENAMVRHEAAEALGAIGDASVVPVLKEFVSDPVPEVSQTCELALKRIDWLMQHDDSETPPSHNSNSHNPYVSVDPAPPVSIGEERISSLKSILVDSSRSMWDRYRAMFSLRNIGSREAVQALAGGLDCEDSALFRHEIAFVLGQVQSDACVEELKKRLEIHSENPMVRHECAEALGAIATLDCQEILKKYLNDKERVVRESCEVALDICDYENSEEFQYADSLLNIEK